MMIWNPFANRRWPNLSMEDIRKRARILVIDDMDFAYLELFKKDGYILDKWSDVEDLPKLESGYYDVVLLDIQGVGIKQSKEQGLGVLKHLRQTSPAQIVIAYSNADFSLKFQEFFQMADSTLAKSADYVDFKRAVDQLLGQRFSLGFYVERVAKIASPYISDISKFNEAVSSSIQKNDKKKLTSYLNDNITDKEAVSMILQVVQVALSIAAL